jgi:hypothetical protein
VDAVELVINLDANFVAIALQVIRLQTRYMSFVGRMECQDNISLGTPNDTNSQANQSQSIVLYPDFVILNVYVDDTAINTAILFQPA